MSDKGEKTCPLCAEEMDLTDQQLKPCRCGYEICVWCWHHIMDMAEKDETEGRCPACRMPYDKEKVVGTAAKCERLAAEICMEKKQKSQRSKTKTSESRKQLSSVRVIQRHLVYIIGLPLNLADEDLLQQREFFAQYGRVLKVSISRTSAGTIQQFANSTCSVYITYSTEEEAVRCIQYVHGFILDGRPLRACFGTTKYCHAWLRNVPCSNPDCLYLHEIGSQEDSFTKDEIISAYTRSRVQQLTGSINNMQCRSGDTLPPPADDCCNDNTIVKPVVECPSSNSIRSVSGSPPTSSSGRQVDNTTNNLKGLPPTSSSGRSGGLPPAASWGSRASNCNAPSSSLPCSNGPTKQTAEAMSSTTMSSSKHMLPSEAGKRPILNEGAHPKQTKHKLEILDSGRQHAGLNSHTNVSQVSSTPSGVTVVKVANQSSFPPAADTNSEDASVVLKSSLSGDGQPCSRGVDRGRSSVADEKIQNLCSDILSMGIDNRHSDEQADVNKPNVLCLDNFISSGSRGHNGENLKEQLTSATVTSAASTVDSVTASSEACDCRSDVHVSVAQNLTLDSEDDFDNQRYRDAIVSPAIVPLSSPFHLLSHKRGPSPQQHVDAYGAVNYSLNPPIVDRTLDINLTSDMSYPSVASNEVVDSYINRASGQGNTSFLNVGQRNQIGRFDGGLPQIDLQPSVDMGESSIISDMSYPSVASNEVVDSYINRASGQGNTSFLNVGQRNQIGRFEGLPQIDSQPSMDMGESSIISNILDLDSWDESLTSPQNLAKLLGDSDNDGPVKLASSWKGQMNHQSRFSFARQESSRNRLLEYESSVGNMGQVTMNRSVGQTFFESRDPLVDRLDNGFGFAQCNIEQSEILSNGNSVFPPVTRSQISAPPGFSAPSRPPPPPGFTLHDRNEQTFDMKSGNHMLETSAMLRNHCQVSSISDTSNPNDIEFIDPAILAVGKGRLSPSGGNYQGIDMRSNFHVQAPTFENDPRLLLLMQRSLAAQQNNRYADIRDNFSTPNDTYGFTSRHVEQPQNCNYPPFSQFQLQQGRNAVASNGNWDSWNEIQASNDMNIEHLLRNDRLGLNKLGMTNSGDLYNRSFRM